ncbi:hypothetical protein CG709_02705, partial [Lachnotalea glycerini]
MYHMLIADDEPIERMVICKTVKAKFKNQFEIVQAVNGREAIELFKEKKFHIVILDIEMPGITGLEAAEKIRKMDKYCNIIFLTAYDDFSYAKKAITIKALNYLLKPSSEDEIVSVVNEAIKMLGEQEESDTQKGLKNKETFDTTNDKLEYERISV